LNFISFNIRTCKIKIITQSIWIIGRFALKSNNNLHHYYTQYYYYYYCYSYYENNKYNHNYYCCYYFNENNANNLLHCDFPHMQVCQSNGAVCYIKVNLCKRSASFLRRFSLFGSNMIMLRSRLYL